MFRRLGFFFLFITFLKVSIYFRNRFLLFCNKSSLLSSWFLSFFIFLLIFCSVSVGLILIYRLLVIFILMRLRMFLLHITFLNASHSFSNRLLVICKNAYLFATMIMTSVSSPFSCCSGIVRLNLM